MTDTLKRAHEAIDQLSRHDRDYYRDLRVQAAHAALDAAVDAAGEAGIAKGSECTATPGCPHPANYCDGCHEKSAQAREQAAFRRGARQAAMTYGHVRACHCVQCPECEAKGEMHSRDPRCAQPGEYADPQPDEKAT